MSKAGEIRVLFEEVLEELARLLMERPEDGYERSLPTMRDSRVEDDLSHYRARLQALLDEDHSVDMVRRKGAD